MLSVKQASEILEISKPTLIRYIRQGKVKAIRMGHVYKITQEEVDRILQHGTS